MKNKKLIYLLTALLLIVSTLAGCGQEARTTVQHESKNDTKVEEPTPEVEEPKAEEPTTEEPATEKPETDEPAAEKDEADEPETEASEEDYEDHYETSFHYYDEMFNSDPVDLTPDIREFYADDPEADGAFSYTEDPNGTVYGFEDDLTDGCSVWCSIGDYNSEVSATSALDPIGDNTYDAENIADRDRTTAWVEGVDGDGIGEKIFINRTYWRGGDVNPDTVSTNYDSIFFPQLMVVNGLAKSEDAYKKNGRVKSLKMYFNDEYICTLELEDTLKPQYISLFGLHLSAKSGEESRFTFEIEDVYKGTKYDDTAITGIEIAMFTENH